MPDEISLSVAIGDAVNDPDLYSKRALLAASAGADIVKVGLLDFRDDHEKLSFLSGIRRNLDEAGFENAGLVPALYADLNGVDELLAFPGLASDIGIVGCLIDTFSKDGRDVFYHLNRDAIKEFANVCGRHRIFSALAGGLSVDSFGAIADAGVDVIGFRSAVALSGRGRVGVDKVKVAELLDIAKT